MKKILLLIFIAASSLSQANAQLVKPFKAGDRVAFTGNSITEGGFYHSFIWLYYMTRFPNERITIFNCGIGGDTALEIDKRFEGDILSKKPTAIVLTFGMNDSGYFEYNGDNPQAFADEKVAKSYEHYQNIQKKLLGLYHTRITLMGSSPYDETAKIENTAFRNKNKAMLRIVDFQKKSAEANKWEFTDLNVPMCEISLVHQKKDSTFALCGNDRIHPDNDGHMVMAYLFLRAQGFAGKKVADVNINAIKHTVTKSENCKISNLNVASGKVSFNYLANALPYPLDTIPHGWGQTKSQAAAMKIVPFMDEMNQEILAVSNLQGEQYELSIDGIKIGNYSGKELAKGVNLATCVWAPQYRQAMKVMHLNGERFEIERRTRELAWIQYNFFLEYPFTDSPETLERYNKEAVNNGWLRGRKELFTKAIHPEVREIWQAQMDMLTSKIYEINKPVSRKVVLKPIAQ